MFRIAVCDDESAIAAFVENAIVAYVKNVNLKVEVEVFGSGKDLCAFLEESSSFDLIYLDIEMQQKDGIETGKWIRETLKEDMVQIVYMSAYSKYAMELFKIRPMDFMVKPFTKNDVIENLEKAIRLSDKLGQLFTYKIGRDIKKIPIRDILYFKINNREISMVTDKGTEVYYGSLEKIYERLKEYRFFYTHQSYLVSYSKIVDFTYSELVLTNGLVIPISQGKRKEVRELQLRYAMEEEAHESNAN